MEATVSNNPYGAGHVVAQAKWFAGAKVGCAIVALLTQLVLVRHLVVEDYATYTIFIAATSVLVLLTMFGMDRVIYRFIPPLRGSIRWREMIIVMAGLTLVRQLFLALLFVLVWIIAPYVIGGELRAQVQPIAVQYVIFSVALSFTDSFSIFCNGLGLQGRQSMLLLFTSSLRLILIFVWMALPTGLTVVEVASIMGGMESLLALMLLLVLYIEMQALRSHAQRAESVRFGFSIGAIVKDSLSTQLTYIMNLPFRGTFLRLIVGAVAPPVVTAAFGFLQTMADRVYQFMPMLLMKGVLEPALASEYAAHRNFDRVRLTVSLLLRINFLILFFGLSILLGCGEQLIDWITNGRYGSEVMLAGLILIQLAGMTLGESLWISLNSIGRIAYHNKLWTWFSLACYGGLAGAAFAHSTIGLVLVSTTPYLLVFGWLRWVSHEPFLQGGLKLERVGRLCLPTVLAALSARAVLTLPAGNWTTMCAVMLALAVFAVTSRFIGLFGLSEVVSVSAVSPRFARLLKPLSS